MGAGEFTGWLRAWAEGDQSALHQLIPLVERELNRIAHRCLAGERSNGSVSATALVNEAFLRLVELDKIEWHDRAHFLAVSARFMRRILVDLARARKADKRGGDVVRITLDEALVEDGAHDQDLIRLDDALQGLAALDARKARVVDLRFFAGSTVEETAAALGVSVKTVVRDWTFAKAWLQRAMTEHRS